MVNHEHLVLPTTPATTSGYGSFAGAPIAEYPTRTHGETPPPHELNGGIKTTWVLCNVSLDSVRDVYKDNVGLLLVTASQVFFAAMNVAVKKLNSIDPPVPVLELVFVRMAITYLCSITYMLAAGINDPFTGPKGVRLLLVTRGFFGFFGLFGIYYSLQYLSLSDATVLTFLAPLCTTVTGAFFLGEKFGYKEALAGIVSLLGVVLIARPASIFGDHPDNLPIPEGKPDAGVTPAQRLMAVGFSMVGVLGATGAYTSIRAIGKRAHPLHSLTSFSSQCIIASSVGMVITRTQFIVPTEVDWLLLFLMIGIFGFVAQIFLTMGLQRETVGRGTIAIYTQIIFATIMQAIFFHTVPSLLSIIGTIMIIFSALYVAVTKETTPPKNSKSPITLAHAEEDDLETGLLSRPSDDSLDYLPPAPPIQRNHRRTSSEVSQIQNEANAGHDAPITTRNA